MRHQVVGRRLGYGPSHQKAMMRSLAGSLIKYETIETTLPRAKELRRLSDRLVTLGKKNSLHARRQAFKLLNDHVLVKKLFDEIAPQFQDRPGGYTRVIKSRFRAGDNAPMSVVTFTTRDMVKNEKPVTEKTSSISEEVKQGVEAELGAEGKASEAVEENAVETETEVAGSSEVESTVPEAVVDDEVVEVKEGETKE
ncbi:MAG: 50S ribosomal protein L17 [Deltaproteobacteria bacterium]|nr:50S ribosomal protein L17 [Deltaproteobacteria bacterium]